MRNRILAALILIALIATPALAGSFKVNTTSFGQFTNLKILGAEDSTKSGRDHVIDVRAIRQKSATGAVPVLTLDQDDVDQAVLQIECTEADLNSCSCYTSTNSTKVGAIKVEIDNGSTTETRWIQLFNDPD